ncbi:hypothetical protein ACN42_g7665 [Penicillium freii]|uniref:Uncharacterized protein n=1 Tax=Penicillium freii TaxID=48697 RepID=A0A117NMM5_PENFR|nr:hypothetical protein ACN42_g7665 [Penicillium freii]
MSRLYISEPGLSELRYSGLFGLVCNSPVQGQVITMQIKRYEQIEHVQTNKVYRNQILPRQTELLYQERYDTRKDRV